MIDRFSGEAGRPRLLELLLRQETVRGDDALAEALADSIDLAFFDPAQPLIHQDRHDDDLFLILTGEVQIAVNERLIATRFAGTHVGEMALIDPESPRSATVTAGPTGATVARIKADHFIALADKYPHVWRALAVELVHRLQQRGRFHAPPNPVPELFVGCSRERLAIAAALQSALRDDALQVRIWTDGIFEAGDVPIGSLLTEVASADFAVLILGPDDGLQFRGADVPVTRDNVVFELGLFMGVLGRPRALILRPRDIDLHLPSDLLGITPVSYDAGGDIDAAIGVAANEIRDRVRKLGAK